MANLGSATIAFAGLLAAGGPALAAQPPSGCVTCHLDEAKLSKNLAVVQARKSSLQSGKG